MAAGDGWYEELLGRGGCRVGSEKGTSLDAVVEVARRVLDLAPGIGDVAGEDGREHLTKIIENSLEY